MTGILLVGAFAFTAYTAVLYFSQRSIIFPAPRAAEIDDSILAGRLERVWLDVSDGQVEAWFLPPLSGNHTKVPVVVFTHGNGELIDYWLSDFETVQHWGLGVFLVEFPGYGRSDGTASESSITATMHAAYDYLAARPDVDNESVIAYGRSVGGGAACGLARDRKVVALILESSFTSVPSLAWRSGFPGFLVKDPFNNLDVVRDFPGPTLIMHGERDEYIPVAHAHRLHEAADVSKLHIFECGHNDCKRPWRFVHEFLSQHGFL